jgi:hypothetical protein
MRTGHGISLLQGKQKDNGNKLMGRHMSTSLSAELHADPVINKTEK